MADYFPKGAAIRRISIEPVLLLGGGRALLLQLAHPAVAQGVHDHSDFKRNPLARLQGTVEAMNAVVYGSEELARGVGDRISWIHDFVVGPTYRANAVENLLWVHATLLDTIFRAHQEFVGPLSDAFREAVYADMVRVAEVFGIPAADQPADLAEFDDYFAAAVAGLEVTDVGRELGQFIVAPTLPLRLHVALAPALGLHRRITLALTPPSLRDQFGLAWSADDERRYRRTRRRVRATMNAVPYGVRTAPNRAANRLHLLRATRQVERWRARRADASAPRHLAPGAVLVDPDVAG